MTDETIDGAGPEVRTKEYYINQATQTLNDASRISPSYPPLFLARGVLSLLRASVIVQSKPGSSSIQENSERLEALRQALKCFEDALRLSNGRNIMASIGRARVYFSQGNFAEALKAYQTVLERAPQLSDPDPRIGIGCCLWQLGHRNEAKIAWERSLQVNPNSKHANILLGIFHLQHSSQFATSDPEFTQSYKKAMTQYTQTAFKLDNKLPLACATFGGLFLMRQQYPNVEKLARSAITNTDINAIASDGWYLLARKEHQLGDYEKAKEYYTKADQARGGDEKGGYLPAKFGVAQIEVIKNELQPVKFRLEKLVQTTKSIEALTLLGTLHAESVFAQKITTANKDDVAKEKKKAIATLEQVRTAWKDPKRKATVDASVLLNLARLYELDAPEKSLQCLKQVEQIEIDAIPEDVRPTDIEDTDELQQALREMIPPPLLNNLGCFYFQAEKQSEARDMFQTALNACVKRENPEDGGTSSTDTDALVTTISYNLARTYEAEGKLEEAQAVYDGLLARHPNYSDALIRVAFIAYQRKPEEGAKEMQELFDSENDNLDIRVIYGWFLNRTKRRTTDFAADAEQRLNKHTLIQFDRSDPYLLTSMGNICLSIARELRGDKEKERRATTYQRAIDFFDAALKNDPYNAYAAQGLAIVVAEAKKDLPTALQILSNVRETMRDATVYMNLGHVFAELKQFARAIENYETALAKKDRVSELSVLSALGRVWYMKGRTEKNLAALKQALDYSRRVIALQPDQPHYRFNIAFVQFQIAQLLCSLPAQQRSLEDVETAHTDLESAIEEFFAVAKVPNPPFPRSELEQRANMGKTMAKQLDRALEDQRKYAAQNAEKIEAARKQREAIILEREEAKKRAEQEAEERKAKILEERRKMEERDREIAEQERIRREEERAREEEQYTTDSQTGEKKKRARAPRKSTGGGPRRKGRKRGSEDAIGSEGLSAGEGSGAASDGGAPHQSRKKRRLERGGRRTSGGAKKKSAVQNSKYKSSEMIMDSDEEAGLDDDDEVANGTAGESSAAPTPAAMDVSGDEEEETAVVRPRKKAPKKVISDDEDDDDEDDAPQNQDVDMAGAESDA
jgi:RNA polymerase-associated protein CTR9